MIKQKGFTILELVVSISIFAMMTALVLSKYGKFNQGVLLTNLAYDVALSIRNAQSYGLSVKSSDRSANDFDEPYGVHFDMYSREKFIFFVGSMDKLYYDNQTTQSLSTTQIKRGSSISNLCVVNSSNGSCDNVINLDIIFKRPDPSAIIVESKADSKVYSRAEITVSASDKTTKKIIVNSTGQISVK